MKQPAVYILASGRNGTLYIGVTSNLTQRVWQHREGLADGFTKQYGVKMLVWYEQHATMESAISREKAMKKWLRKWKLAIIEKTNPYWHDLWPEITGTQSPSVIHAEVGTQTVAATETVTPSVNTAQAGIQGLAEWAATRQSKPLDSRLRGNDEEGAMP
jgi:putative endonuclease